MRNPVGKTWTIISSMLVCLNQTLVSHQMRNFQLLTEKKGISPSTSILEMTTLGMLNFIALQVAFVKIWCQSLQQQLYLDNYQILLVS